MKSVWRDEEGLTTVEYALLLTLLVIGAITVWTAFGNGLRGSVESSTGALADAGGDSN
jgi:Flp pilus assembly pilin Flp